MKYTSELERPYLMRKLSISDNTKPLNQLRREFYLKTLNNARYSAQTPFNELEWDWLLKTIATGGKPEPEDWDDAWRTMVTLVSKIPTNSTDENIKIYYANAT